MSKRLALRALGTGLFALPILVLTLSFSAVASTVEAQSCPACHPVELDCRGSTCECEWVGELKCLPVE
jgi:hypothetical protein